MTISCRMTRSTSTPLITGLLLAHCKDIEGYYLLRFHNALFLKAVRLLFDNQGVHERNHHDGFRGIRTHENSLFLYKSDQADAIVRSRVIDYFLLFGGLSAITGMSQFILLPLAVMAMSFPRKLAVLQFFTFHAELLPHTEQVVFHKASLFGKVRRIYVDIKNLEKIEADVVPSKI